MAIIGKIRKHGGLTVGIIAAALGGFILLQDQNMTSCNKNKQMDFAIIGGQKILKQEFDIKYEQQAEQYRKQSQKENLTSAENFQIMLMTWEQLEKEVIMQKEFEELGIAIERDNSFKASISPEELYDLMVGKNLHPYIVQTFSDPTTGQVNRQQVTSILQNFDQLSDEDKKQWKNLELAIKDDRVNQKYNTLITQGYYMPAAFAKRAYDDASRIAKFRYFGVKYQTIGDSTITLTDADYQKYYDEHSYEYEQEASVDFDFVVWDVIPSAEDNKKIKEDVDRLYSEFSTIDNKEIENFVIANSDTKWDSLYFKKGTLPVKIDSIMFNSEVGTCVEPYSENNVWVMARLLKVQDRPDSMLASQIMITHKDAPGADKSATRTKEAAKALVDSLLTSLQNDSKQFSLVALQVSEFPNVQADSGNLHWFGDGDMNFKFFYDSCFFMKIGEMRIIESNMGYHVLYCKDKQAPIKKVKVALLEREIKPSTNTYNEYFGLASEFAGANRTAEDFNKTIVDKGLNKRQAQYIRKMDLGIPGIDNAREIIRWAYDENTPKGAVSQSVFDCEGKYVVALLSEKREKGIATLEQVKTYIEPLVKREKKAEKIIANINTAMSTTKDIYQLAPKTGAVLDTLDFLTFSAYNFPNFGPEPQLIGSIFSMKKGVLSKPIKGTAAVFVVLIDEFVEPPVTQNYSGIRMQMQSYFKQRVGNDIFNAIKDKTEITDNRILYY